uniref:Secretory calcium-binding phosphoprotein 7 n=1 Tax=Panagrellus redivivus TaxID=6233 RepID=A0A7E4V0G5_PANRE
MNNMLIVATFLLLAGANAQFAAWPATSYSPFYDALFRAASQPVLAAPSGIGMRAPAIPIPAPIPVPVAMAAPMPMPMFAPPPPPVFAPPAVIFAPSAGYYTPKAVPAGPFNPLAVRYGRRS